MRYLFTSLGLAAEALRAHRVRTFLAVLGVAIGISSIIIVFSAGEGVKGMLLDQVEFFGADVIQVEIKVPSSKEGLAGERQSAASLLQGAQVTTLDHDDLEELLELPNIINGYGLLMTQESVSYQGEVRRAFVWASGSAFVEVDSIDVTEGRFFTGAEDRSLAKVAVLGAGIKNKLFGESDPIGTNIQVRDTKFKVIGVMESRGAILGFNFDDFIYVPVKTLQKRIMGAEFLHNIIVQVDNTRLMDGVAERMREVLRENHNIRPSERARESIWDTGNDDFRVASMTEALSAFDTMFQTLTWVLLAIVVISLVVGGVGVMNVMYVIVNERTPEIGLRKAMGATFHDIRMQFLLESVLITLVGGVLGVVFGVLISYGVAVGARASGIVWGFSVPPLAFLIAFLFSITFGVLFGMYPAKKAALLDPIEALRHEQ